MIVLKEKLKSSPVKFKIPKTNFFDSTIAIILFHCPVSRYFHPRMTIDLTLNNLLQFLFIPLQILFFNFNTSSLKGTTNIRNEQQEQKQLIETFTSTRFFSHGRRR